MKLTPRLPDDSPNLPSVHPAREAVVLVVAVGAIASVVLVVAAFLVELLLPLVPVGIDAEIEMTPPLPLAAGPETASIEASLQALAEGVAAGWPDSPYRLRVRMIRADAPNAFALVGGQILVTRALVDQAQSEDELAFVLGHEIGHLENRDHLRSLGRTGLLALVAVASGIGGSGETLLGASQLMALRFNREQERAADAVGLELLHRRYGHVYGAVQFFEHLAEARSTENEVPTFLSTHPGSLDRAQAAITQARARGYPTVGTLTPNATAPGSPR